MGKTQIIVIALLIALIPAAALSQQTIEGQDQLTISLEEAIEIALVNNHMLRRGALDIETADAQIREAWGQVYPQVSFGGNYTRNVRSPDPFAGSDAGSFFEGLGAIEWLAFNERARTDGDPSTDPIPFDEFMDRQQQGYQEAGVSVPGSGDNIFAVDNQFQFGLSVSQALYNGSAFAAIRGARQLREVNEDQLRREEHEVVNQITETFYGALLTQEQTRVLRTSAERLRRTVEEINISVREGVLSKFDRTSAEVELVNLETQLIEAENQARIAVRGLALQLGIPIRTALELRGELAYDDSMTPDMLDADEAYILAKSQRPDVSQANNAIDLLRVQRNITRSRHFPVVSAFADYAYLGNVPDNRQVINQVQGQDFTYETSNRGFFNDAYWDQSFAVGIRMNWSIFTGFQTRRQIQQNTIAIRQAQIDYDFLENAIYLEIDQAIRDLETAYRRIMSQQRNIEQAELNYEFSRTRLREGVGTPLEERQASSLLDQSKLNYLAAVYDFVTAKSRYEKAIGTPIQNRF